MGDMAEYDAGEHYIPGYSEQVQSEVLNAERRHMRPSWSEFMEQVAPTAPSTMRDVRSLRLSELIPMQRSHRRKPPVEIDGQAVVETLRERLDRETRELMAAASLISTQLGKRAEQLEHLKRFPVEDPFENGEVLRFEKVFPHGDNVYSYVAHKTNDLWYLTGGRSPQGITWDKFVDWMGLGVEKVYRVRGGKKVIG